MSKFLREKQKIAVVMLLSGFKGGEVARRLGVRPETISRWRAMPHFKAHLEDIRLQCRESLRQRIFFLVEDTVAVLNNAIRQEWRPDKQARIAIDTLHLLASTNVMSHAAMNGTDALDIRATSPAHAADFTPGIPGVAEEGPGSMNVGVGNTANY